MTDISTIGPKELSLMLPGYIVYVFQHNYMHRPGNAKHLHLCYIALKALCCLIDLQYGYSREVRS